MAQKVFDFGVHFDRRRFDRRLPGATYPHTQSWNLGLAGRSCGFWVWGEGVPTTMAGVRGVTPARSGVGGKNPMENVRRFGNFGHFGVGHFEEIQWRT